MKVRKIQNGEKFHLNDLKENTLFDAIRNYIKTNNFPKKLVLRKFDLLIEKHIDKKKKVVELIDKSIKTNKGLKLAIEDLSSKNRSKKDDLLRSLT